jgi:hypothetical protein
MRILQLLDPAYAHPQVYYRMAPPPAKSPPRRIQAVNRPTGPNDPSGEGTSPPDDGISLALSPEAREAARRAALEQARTGQAGEPAGSTGAPAARSNG